MIGQFGERNVARMSAAVSFGGTLRDIQKTAARETTGVIDCFRILDVEFDKSTWHVGISCFRAYSAVSPLRSFKFNNC